MHAYSMYTPRFPWFNIISHTYTVTAWVFELDTLESEMLSIILSAPASCIKVGYYYINMCTLSFVKEFLLLLSYILLHYVEIKYIG